MNYCSVFSYPSGPLNVNDEVHFHFCTTACPLPAPITRSRLHSGAIISMLSSEKFVSRETSNERYPIRSGSTRAHRYPCGVSLIFSVMHSQPSILNLVWMYALLITWRSTYLRHVRAKRSTDDSSYARSSNRSHTKYLSQARSSHT